MGPANYKPRIAQEGSILGKDNHDKDTTTGKKWETVSGTSSTSIQSNQRDTAAYLRNQARPPFVEGMQAVSDALFQRFLQGEIPDDHAQQLQIAQTCIDHGFSCSLAWLFVKTEMTEFIYRSSTNRDGLLTLARTLEYSGLSLTSLVIEIPIFTVYDLEDIESKICKSDSLKEINLSNTIINERVLELFKEIKGPNGDSIVTGGRIKVEPSSCSSFSGDIKLPAVTLSPEWIEAASKGVLEMQRKQGISALAETRKINMEDLAEVQVPDISGFSENVKSALKFFFKKAYEIPYFMLHTTFSANMNSIFSMGSLTSRARLEKFPGKSKFSGLKDSGDVENNEHQMIFAAMGTNANSIRPPSTFDQIKKSHNCSSVLIDVDLFMQNNHSARKHMIIKSCDWGDLRKTSDKDEYVTQIIKIPNTSIKITRLDMNARNGAINPDAMIRYKYENGENGYSKEYALPVYGDIVTGVNYRQLVPLLFVQHFRQLDEKEQLAILAGIREELNESGDQERAAEGILEAFSPLEISIPGSLPLQLEYVDLVEHDKQIFDFKAIRNAVQQGRVDEFIVLMEKAGDLPGGQAPDWLINGIHGIAMKNWLTERTKSESGQQADRFLAILDFIEPRYQQIWLERKLDYKPDYTSLDLLKASDELNTLTVPPSRVNRLILELSAKQEKVEAYLVDNRNTILKSLKCLREAFNTEENVSELGLQSTLKAKVIGSSRFNDLVKDRGMIKSLVYLASATPALITKIFGEIDLKVFQARNSFSELDIIGHIGGIRKPDSKSHANRSFLSDLLFNIPGNSLFVPANGMPNNKAKPFSPEDVVKAAYDYQLLFSALRGVLREENLIDIPPTIGEQLLLERYVPSKWSEYKNRFLALAELSKHTRTIKDGGENKYLRSANDVIQNLSVMNPEYAHFNLDPRHLQAVLAGKYGDAKPAFDELVETIAENSETDENHRTTAIQLFHRMKLLEFEFYKDQLIHDVKLGFDDYARNVLASMRPQ